MSNKVEIDEANVYILELVTAQYVIGVRSGSSENAVTLNYPRSLQFVHQTGPNGQPQNGVQLCEWFPFGLWDEGNTSSTFRHDHIVEIRPVNPELGKSYAASWQPKPPILTPPEPKIVTPDDMLNPDRLG